jgi:hypothetical protein
MDLTLLGALHARSMAGKIDLHLESMHSNIRVVESLTSVKLDNPDRAIPSERISEYFATLDRDWRAIQEILNDMQPQFDILNLPVIETKDIGKCSRCDERADLACNVGKCGPRTLYCAYHYGQEHLPEDERDAEGEQQPEHLV